MLQIVSIHEEHVECKKFFKLIKVNCSFKTICSQTPTKKFGNLSILPIQLIKKGTISWIWRSRIQIPLMHVEIWICEYFCLTRDTIAFARLLMWIRKKSGSKIDCCGTSEDFDKIKGCHILTLSHLMAEVIYHLGSKVKIQCWTQSIIGDSVYLCYCKLRLVTPHDGGCRDKIFDFDNPRLLEKALSG